MEKENLPVETVSPVTEEMPVEENLSEETKPSVTEEISVGKGEEKTAPSNEKKKKRATDNEDLYFENDAQARKYETQRRIKLFFIYFFLAVAALFTLIPFYWMIVTSFKDADELVRTPPTFIPLNPTFDNYKTVFNPDNSKLLTYILNTLIVACSTTVLVVITTIMAAFAFSRLEFKGRDTIFSLLLATMMVPGEMMIMTNYTTVANMGLTDMNTSTVADFILCCVFPFATSVFYIFFLRQNFKQIPNELYYAAKVDGNSDFRYLFKVMIPIAKPAIITITILSCIGSWNAYIWPRTVSFSRETHLITDGLMYMMQSIEGTDTSNIMMAATTIVSIPLLVAFALFKKYIMRGVARSGIKG